MTRRRRDSVWIRARHASGLALLVAMMTMLSAGALAHAGDRDGSAESIAVPDELLVAFKPGTTPAQAAAAYARHGGTLLEELPELRIHRIRVAPAALEAVEQALSHHPNVEFVERNVLLRIQMSPNDPSFSKQWHHPKIGTPGAWDITTGTNVIIAVFDTGVDSSHPDLAANLVAGYNAYNDNTDTRDVHGHGTRTAGIAGAVGNNATGVAGVSWRSRIMPMRVTDSTGYVRYSDLAKAMTWAVDRGARVLSMSIGGVAASSTVTQAAQYARGKGAVAVAAGGNCGCSDSTPENPYIISVSATDQNDAIASFSAYGPYIDVAAPSYIMTTAPGGGYTTMGGTSASTPVAAGVVALMIAANPRLSPSEIETLLEAMAVDLGAGGWDPRYGWGRVDAYRAVAAAAGTAATSDTTKPSVSITSPTGGATVSGTVAVSASASDNVGVARVDLYVDGRLTTSDSTAPYAFAWNTTTLSDGSHTLVAKAYDAAGNEGVSSGVTVQVGNSTSGGDTSPPAGDTTTSKDTTAPTTSIGAVWIDKKKLHAKVLASDNVGVVKVELYLNGVLKATSTSAPVTFTIPLSQLKSGSNSLQSKAFDAAGNVGSSAVTSYVK